MSTALDAKSLASLLDELMKWLKDNPNGNLDEFAADHHCSVEDISDSWNTFFDGDFSRKYHVDTDQGHGYHPAPPPHGDPQALKSYIVKEVNTYQQYTTVNNITDNSFNQQIYAKGDVNQDIDIDNSHNVADHGGVVVRDSSVDGNLTTGEGNVVDSNGNVNTGDIHTSAGDHGQAATNLNFGSGDLNNTQQLADVDVSGDNTTGDTGSADGIGAAGGHANSDADAHAGDGGDGGHGGAAHDGGLLAGGIGGEGGDGGAGGGAGASSGADAHGGDGSGGISGDSGDAGHHVDVHF